MYGPRVKVVPDYGLGALGEMDPRPGMLSDLGTVISVDSAEGTVMVSGANVGSADLLEAHAGQLQVTSGEAYYDYSWPTGDNSLVYGHQDLTPIALASPRVSAVVQLPNGAHQSFAR